MANKNRIIKTRVKINGLIVGYSAHKVDVSGRTMSTVEKIPRLKHIRQLEPRKIRIKHNLR